MRGRNEIFTVARDHLVTAEITASTRDRRFRLINDRKSGLKDRLARVKVNHDAPDSSSEWLLISSLEKFPRPPRHVSLRSLFNLSSIGCIHF